MEGIQRALLTSKIRLAPKRAMAPPLRLPPPPDGPPPALPGSAHPPLPPGEPACALPPMPGGGAIVEKEWMGQYTSDANVCWELLRHSSASSTPRRITKTSAGMLLRCVRNGQKGPKEVANEDIMCSRVWCMMRGNTHCHRSSLLPIIGMP